MRASTISTLFALLPLLIAAPLPIRRDLLGGLDLGLGLLGNSDGPLDSLTDSSGGLLNIVPSPVKDLTSSTPLQNDDGLFGLPSKLLGHSPTKNGLLDDLLSSLTSTLNPNTDVLGDILDLGSPTKLTCADVGALLLGDKVDIGICACVGLGLKEEGKDGLWLGRGREGALEGLGVGVGLVAGLDLNGLRDKVRQTGREDFYPAHVLPRCDGGGGYICPVVYQRPDGICGPPDEPFVPIPVPTQPTSTSSTPVETSTPTTETAVIPQSEPTPTPVSEPVSTAEPTPIPTPAPVAPVEITSTVSSIETTSTSSAIVPAPTEVIDAEEPSNPVESYPEDEEINAFGGNGVNRAAKPHHTPEETEGSEQLVDAESTEAPTETETVTVLSEPTEAAPATETVTVFAEAEPTPTPTPSETMTVITVPVTVNVVTITTTVTETAAPTATATTTQYTTETIHDISTEHHTETSTQTQTIYDCVPTPTPTVVAAQVAPTSIIESSRSSVAPPTSTSIPEPLIVLPPPSPICSDGEEFKQTVCCRADMYEVDGQCKCSPGLSDNISLGICLDLDLCLGEILNGECIVEKLGLDTALPLGLGRVNL